MFEVPTWPVESPKWNLGYKSVLLDGEIHKPNKVSLEKFIKNSAAFPIKFPIDTGRCKVLKKSVSSEILERNINSVYPVLSEDSLLLYARFILYKRKYGSEHERSIYANMSVIKFIDRLLLKRAVAFVGRHDRYLLLDGRNGLGIEKLRLDECLSYDEIKLSALLSVSSYSQFINDGNRKNLGVPKNVNIEEEGIVVGLIGTRLVKPNVMEYQEIVIDRNQNHELNGYGKQFAPTMHSLFAEFFGEPSYTYQQVLDLLKEQNNRFVEIMPEVIFDKSMYCKRLSLSFDVLLHEANSRARERNTTAFIHVVGIGLGAWRITAGQNCLFLDTFAKRIEFLGATLYYISDIVFAYFGDYRIGGNFQDGEVITIPGHPNGGIKIYFSERQPHTKLTGNDAGKLLVVSYAWDGNALPGNEFWDGSLDTSGDPAEACSSQVAEIHNPQINPQVCAANVKIATHKGLVSFHTYRENIANMKD